VGRGQGQDKDKDKNRRNQLVDIYPWVGVVVGGVVVVGAEEERA
jgi:hypothetical protein